MAAKISLMGEDCCPGVIEEERSEVLQAWQAKIKNETRLEGEKYKKKNEKKNAMMHWQVSEQEGQAGRHIEWQMTGKTDQLFDEEPHRQNDSCKSQNEQRLVEEQAVEPLQVLWLSAQDLM